MTTEAKTSIDSWGPFDDYEYVVTGWGTYGLEPGMVLTFTEEDLWDDKLKAFTRGMVAHRTRVREHAGPLDPSLYVKPPPGRANLANLDHDDRLAAALEKLADKLGDDKEEAPVASQEGSIRQDDEGSSPD